MDQPPVSRVRAELAQRFSCRCGSLSTWSRNECARHNKLAASFSGGDGVIYARQENGDLNWFRHDGWHDGSYTWAAGSGRRVGSGWAFKQVFVS